MEVMKVVVFTVFTFGVVSLIWARFNFFKINSDGSRKIGMLNDPVVLVLLGSTYWSMFIRPVDEYESISATISFLVGAVVFWWAIITAKRLDFANSSFGGRLITDGPYGIVRHPFYISYMFIWLGCVILVQSPFVVVCFAIMACIYVYSAINEERMILSSINALEYEEYRSKVSMFIPFVL